VNGKTAKAIAEMRKDAKPVLDEQAFRMVKADVLKFYGWTWPDHLDLVEGGKALFDYLIVKANS
jgi:hypothetical protein